MLKDFFKYIKNYKKNKKILNCHNKCHHFIQIDKTANIFNNSWHKLELFFNGNSDNIIINELRITRATNNVE